MRVANAASLAATTPSPEDQRVTCAGRYFVWRGLATAVAVACLAAGCGNRDEDGLAAGGVNRPATATVWQEAEQYEEPDAAATPKAIDRPAASRGLVLDPAEVDRPGAKVRYTVTLPEAIGEARLVFRYAREKWGREIPPAEFAVVLTAGGRTTRRTVTFGDTGGWGQRPQQWRLRGVALGDLPAGSCVVELEAVNEFTRVLLDGFWIVPSSLAMSAYETSSLSRMLGVAGGWVGLSAEDAAINQCADRVVRVAARSFDGRKPELTAALEGMTLRSDQAALAPGSLAPGQRVELTVCGHGDAPGDKHIRFVHLELPALDDGIYRLRVTAAAPAGTMAVPAMLWGKLLTDLDATVGRLKERQQRLPAAAEAARCAADFEHAVKYLLNGRELLSDDTFDLAMVICGIRRTIDQSQETLRRLDAGQSPYDGRTGDLRLALRVNGVLAPYRMVIPEGRDPASTMPTVVLIHGSGENEDIWLDMGDDIVAREAARRGYLVLAPRRLAQDERYEILDHFLAEAVKAHPMIDRQRIFLGGHSRGGFASWELAARHPGRFRAIACVCGVTDASLASQLASVPVLLIHGEKDTTVSPQVTRDAAAALQRLGYDHQVHLFPDNGHELRNHAAIYVPLIFDFFDRYR